MTDDNTAPVTDSTPTTEPSQSTEKEEEQKEVRTEPLSDSERHSIIKKAWTKAGEEVDPTPKVEEAPKEEVKEEPKKEIKAPTFLPKEIREEWSSLSDSAREKYVNWYQKQQSYVQQKDSEITNLKKQADISQYFEGHDYYSKLDSDTQKDVIKRLIAKDKQIRENPIKAIAEIAEANHVDLRELFAGNPDLAYDRAQHQAQSQIAALQAENARLQAQQRQAQQDFERRQQELRAQQDAQIQASVQSAINNLDEVSRTLLTTHSDGGSFAQSVAFYAERIEVQNPTLDPATVVTEAVKKAKIEHGIHDPFVTPFNGKSPGQTPSGASPDVERAKAARSIKSSYPGNTASPQFESRRDKIRYLLKNG